MFSKRTPSRLVPNRLSVLLEQKRKEGRSVLDLTQSNPTQADLSYPADAILAAFGDPRSLRYEPAPAGLPEAREAVAGYYRENGLPVRPEQIFLTASTSEAYSFLVKLLLDPGEEVLIPRPSYPLLEDLVAVEGAGIRPYFLRYSSRWSIDSDELRRSLAEPARLPGGQVRAIVAVHPNNPTGSYLKRKEFSALRELCRERDMALIVDEVFSDYALGTDLERQPSTAGEDSVLCFTLSGLSKVAGLPQVKLSWICLSGPLARVEEASKRLGFIADNFLSVSAAAQWAAPKLFELRPRIEAEIQQRISDNWERIASERKRLAPWQLVDPEGGWYAVVRLEDFRSDEEVALDLMRMHDVLVHPGYLFSFPEGEFLVLSLLPPASVFEEGLARLVDYRSGTNKGSP